MFFKFYIKGRYCNSRSPFIVQPQPINMLPCHIHKIYGLSYFLITYFTFKVYSSICNYFSSQFTNLQYPDITEVIKAVSCSLLCWLSGCLFIEIHYHHTLNFQWQNFRGIKSPFFFLEIGNRHESSQNAQKNSRKIYYQMKKNLAGLHLLMWLVKSIYIFISEIRGKLWKNSNLKRCREGSAKSTWWLKKLWHFIH